MVTWLYFSYCSHLNLCTSSQINVPYLYRNLYAHPCECLGDIRALNLLVMLCMTVKLALFPLCSQSHVVYHHHYTPPAAQSHVYYPQSAITL